MMKLTALVCIFLLIQLLPRTETTLVTKFHNFENVDHDSTPILTQSDKEKRLNSFLTGLKSEHVWMLSFCTELVSEITPHNFTEKGFNYPKLVHDIAENIFKNCMDLDIKEIIFKVMVVETRSYHKRKDRMREALRAFSMRMVTYQKMSENARLKDQMAEINGADASDDSKDDLTRKRRRKNRKVAVRFKGLIV